MIRSRNLALTAALATTLGLSACGGGDPMDTGGSDDGGQSSGGVTVGSANFPENELLAEIYVAALSDAGVETTKRLNIGSRETYMAGLEDESIDLIPEYTGALLRYVNPDTEANDAQSIYTELQDELPDGMAVLERSEAENKDSIVVTAETADELSLSSIGDLEAEAPNLVLGGPPEFQERFTGVPGLKEVYGLEFAQYRPLKAGSNLTVQALINGQVDAANIFSTDPAISQNDFVVLDDPENLFPAQNILPLISQDVLNDDIESTLNEVSSVLTTENLTAMMVQVSTDGQDPADVARQFVDEEVGG